MDLNIPRKKKIIHINKLIEQLELSQEQSLQLFVELQ